MKLNGFNRKYFKQNPNSQIGYNNKYSRNLKKNPREDKHHGYKKNATIVKEIHDLLVNASHNALMIKPYCPSTTNNLKWSSSHGMSKKPMIRERKGSYKKDKL